MNNEVTASRHSLSNGWNERRQALDCMGVPGMASYVNGLVSGKPLHQRGHWAQHAADKFVIPMSERLGRPIRMVTMACGKASIEFSLLGHGWPIGAIVGLEYDSELRRSATDRWSARTDIVSQFQFFDFNRPIANLPWQPDIVFTHHSIHHATNLEELIPFIQRMMDEDTLFIGSDFFGPTRFQVDYEVRPIVDRLNDLLPLDLRRDLRSGNIVQHVQYSTIQSLMKIDPSESARSQDLRNLLFSNFDVVERKPMGLTILRWLFQYRAGNFDKQNPYHVALAACLIELERTLIETRAIQSDDLFFVLKKRVD